MVEIPGHRRVTHVEVDGVERVWEEYRSRRRQPTWDNTHDALAIARQRGGEQRFTYRW